MGWGIIKLAIGKVGGWILPGLRWLFDVPPGYRLKVWIPWGLGEVFKFVFKWLGKFAGFLGGITFLAFFVALPAAAQDLLPSSPGGPNWEWVGLVVAAILSLSLSFKYELAGLDAKDFMKLVGRKGFAFLVIEFCIYTAF